MVIGGVLLWGGLAAKVQTYMLLFTFLGIWWMVQGIFDIAGIFVDRYTYLIPAFLIRKDWLFTSFRSKR